MMTEKEARKVLFDYLGEEPVVMLCKDCNKAFGYYIAAPGTDPSKPAFVGNAMLCVLKDTGEVLYDDDRVDTMLKAEKWNIIGEAKETVDA